MKPLIPPSFYTDTEIFAKEQNILFPNLWNFAGLATKIGNHNDYITTQIGGQSLIIQNMNGELRAFRNVCSHRFSQIRQQPQGNGPLQCPYHGWIYNSEGVPVGIPHQSGFADLTEDTKKSLRLERWLVEKVGVLLFVKRQDDGVSLKDFLGSNYETLISFSEVMNEKIDYSELIINANWKICVENGLEGYHVASVHGQTFGTAEQVEESFSCESPHSHYSSISEKTRSRIEKIKSIIGENKIDLDRYYHYLIFPTLTIATRYGIWFIVSSLYPLSPGKTKIIKQVFARKFAGNYDRSNLDSMSKSIREFAASIWLEDKAICEQVHLGMLSVDKPIGIFHQKERRVYQFHQAYIEAMEKASNQAIPS